MSPDEIKNKVAVYYTAKLKQFGARAQGVDWNSKESQELRFKQLLKVVSADSGFSVNDLGCGYGALNEYMLRQGMSFKYLGYDLSSAMIAEARRLSEGESHCEFVVGDKLREADYTLACGVFSVKLDVAVPDWESYVLEALNEMNRKSRKGFAFNSLTRYSDEEYMTDKLYYPDPAFYFDYCKRNFSSYVALLHDYPLYEFSILVRKDI